MLLSGAFSHSDFDLDTKSESGVGGSWSNIKSSTNQEVCSPEARLLLFSSNTHPQQALLRYDLLTPPGTKNISLQEDGKMGRVSEPRRCAFVASALCQGPKGGEVQTRDGLRANATEQVVCFVFTLLLLVLTQSEQRSPSSSSARYLYSISFVGQRAIGIHGPTIV